MTMHYLAVSLEFVSFLFDTLLLHNLTHLTAFQLLRCSYWNIENYAHKKSAELLVYSDSKVFGVTHRQNNQKPTLRSVSISTIIPACILLVAKLFESQNKAKTLFQYVLNMCV